MLWILIAATIIGVVVGSRGWIPAKIAKLTDSVMLYCMYALIALMGVKLGLDETLFSYIAIVGFQSLMLCVCVMAGSMFFTWLFVRAAFRLGRIDIYGSDKQLEVSASSPFKMTAFVLLMLFGGVILARLFKALSVIAPFIDNIITAGLSVMVFVAGLGIGQSGSFSSDIRRSGLGLLIVPVATLTGSILTSVLLAPLFGLTPAQSGACGGACGWYTLSGMLLSRYDMKLGAMAFLTNLFRETLSLIIVPFIARRFGPFSAVSLCGATAMDSTLPVIIRSTSPSMSIVAFTSGVLLSLVVPVVLNIFVMMF